MRHRRMSVHDESFVFPRAIEELITNGKSSEDSLRSVYALSLSGLLEPSDWPSALGSVPHPKSASYATVKAPPPGQPEIQKSEEKDADALFGRLGAAANFYEVLGVAPDATDDEIKQEYRSLALQFHPDRFHQSAPELRTKIESAFANILQAYETLSDEKQRAHYDKRSLKPGTKAKLRETNGTRPDKTSSQRDRAEASFQRGINALTRQQYDEAIRSLAEAALLEPREARGDAARSRLAAGLAGRPPQARRGGERGDEAHLGHRHAAYPRVAAARAIREGSGGDREGRGRPGGDRDEDRPHRVAGGAVK